MLGWPRLHLPRSGFDPGPTEHEGPPGPGPEGSGSRKTPTQVTSAVPAAKENSKGACRERPPCPRASPAGRVLCSETSTCLRLPRTLPQSPITLQNQKASGCTSSRRGARSGFRFQLPFPAVSGELCGAGSGGRRWSCDVHEECACPA